MIFNEFIILLFVSIIGIIASGVALRQSRISPILEMKILAVAIIAETVFYLLLLSIVFLAVPNQSLDETGQFLFFLTFPATAISVLAMALVFFLPTFKANYKSLFFLILIITLIVGYAFQGYSRNKILVLEAVFRIQWDDLALLLGSLSVLTVVLLAIVRFRNIRRLLTDNDALLISPAFLAIFGILLLFIVVINGLFDLAPEIPLPYSTFLIPEALLFFLLILGLIRDQHVLFLLPVKLHAIIITDKQSGLVVHAESFTPDSPAEDLLGGLFTALNLSLKETLQSQQDLETISFGDKVIHVAPGRNITSFLILSEQTLVTTALSKHLTRRFESQFETILTSSTSEKLNTANFEPFSIEIARVRQYFAF